MADHKLATPTSEQLEAIWVQVKNWGVWGDEDELGALNYLGQTQRVRGAGLVQEGLNVSLAHDLAVHPTPDTPYPAQHHMLTSGDALNASGIPGYEASQDYVGTQVHGCGLTHIDALCHMFVRGQMYNGFTSDMVKSNGGAMHNSVMSTAEGIAGRGVLLDVPRALERAYFDANEAIGIADLEAAEKSQNVMVNEGDILIISTGRDARKKAQQGILNPFSEGLAGLHPECLPWLHERKVAVLCGDGISDMMPGLGIEMWPFPIHQIGITGIGLHLIDNVRLDDLSALCDQQQRWEFMFTVSPIRIPGGTGCPVNPIAIL
jgi:kynurenine formamidase